MIGIASYKHLTDFLRLNVKRFDTTDTSGLIGIESINPSPCACAQTQMQRARRIARKYVSFPSFFFSLALPGNKFSFRAPCVYQDRRFKFIPVAPLRHAPLAHIVARLFGGATGCNILRHRARSLEYRCPRFCGFSSARGARYFLRLRSFHGPSLAGTFISALRPDVPIEISVGQFRSTKKLFRNLEFDSIRYAIVASKHRNNLPNV